MTTTTNNEIKAHFGRLLLDAYKAKGLTRIDMAKELGVDVRTITSYTQGDALPRVSKRENLERLLGWREGVIREFLVEANSGKPLEQLNLKWATADVEPDVLAGLSAEDLADELLRRLRNAESRVRSLQRELDAVREEVLSQPDYSLAAHTAEPSMIERWRREAEESGHEPA